MQHAFDAYFFSLYFHFFPLYRILLRGQPLQFTSHPRCLHLPPVGGDQDGSAERAAVTGCRNEGLPVPRAPKRESTGEWFGQNMSWRQKKRLQLHEHGCVTLFRHTLLENDTKVITEYKSTTAVFWDKATVSKKVHYLEKSKESLNEWP